MICKDTLISNTFFFLEKILKFTTSTAIAEFSSYFHEDQRFIQ